MQDYPAAHSMDTDWFAVDADGHVGFFCSGEAGAVPKGAKEFWIQDFVAKLPKDNRGIVQLAIDGQMIAAPANLELLEEDMKYGEFMFELILVLESESVIEELQPEVWMQFSGAETVVYVEKCEITKMKSLLESGKVLRGLTWFSLFDNAHIFGIFPFRHDMGGPSPYVRVNVPDRPVPLTSLSEDLQQNMKAVQIPSTRFIEHDEIQPIEHVECRIWGDGEWLDTKRERPEWQTWGKPSE